jgi:hypothetical protein
MVAQMDVQRFFYRVHALDVANRPLAFLGTCFPIGPGGNMLTCRHVVEVDLAEGARLGIYDNELQTYRALAQPPVIYANQHADLALLPNALGRPKAEFLPVLNPHVLRVGEDVYSYGYFSIGGGAAAVESGYFAGKIVNFHQLEHQSAAMMTLPYAVIEGLSGSPVLTYHNGPKVVGVATGNRSTRILAAETLDYKDGEVDFRETINRIVEFGTAMHCAAIVSFLTGLSGTGMVVSDQMVPVPNLD